jgi:ABC-type glycerol-3-phosphate transport system substrate-binding protein
MAMSSWGLWGWGTANDPDQSQIVGKADVGLLYGEEAADTVSATVSGVSGIAVNSGSQNKDLTVEWARRFAGIGQPENIQQAMTLSGMPPVQAWAWNDPGLVADNPALPMLAAQAQYMYSRPSAHVEQYTEWSTMAQIELSKALTGASTPQAALDTIVENSNASFPGVNF